MVEFTIAKMRCHGSKAILMVSIHAGYCLFAVGVPYANFLGVNRVWRTAAVPNSYPCVCEHKGFETHSSLHGEFCIGRAVVSGHVCFRVSVHALHIKRMQRLQSQNSDVHHYD